jgi:phosphotransferase system enzyme I (PtsP)
MGYQALSMNASNLLKVKSVIRGIDLKWAEDLLESVLTLDSPYIVQSTLNLALKGAGFGGYLRPSKLKDD